MNQQSIAIHAGLDEQEGLILKRIASKLIERGLDFERNDLVVVVDITLGVFEFARYFLLNAGVGLINFGRMLLKILATADQTLLLVLNELVRYPFMHLVDSLDLVRLIDDVKQTLSCGVDRRSQHAEVVIDEILRTLLQDTQTFQGGLEILFEQFQIGRVQLYFHFGLASTRNQYINFKFRFLHNHREMFDRLLNMNDTRRETMADGMGIGGELYQLVLHFYKIQVRTIVIRIGSMFSIRSLGRHTLTHDSVLQREHLTNF